MSTGYAALALVVLASYTLTLIALPGILDRTPPEEPQVS